MEDVLVPFIVFATLFGIVYVVISARNKERMALIERGADPKLFESIKRARPHSVIKWGLFLLGIGLGIVIANIAVANLGMSEHAAYPSMICIFGGIALIIAHFFLRKEEQKEGNQENTGI
jgi:drug/metabolite transporter (DMT)-like permease